MSWIKENYHVAALGGGTLVLAGLGYLGFSGNQAVNETFNVPSPNQGKTTTAEGGDIAASVKRSPSKIPLFIKKHLMVVRSISFRVSTFTLRMETRWSFLIC
jgi:hypothetical protein